MNTQETINQLAEVIVSALVDRLAHSEELAARLAPLVIKAVDNDQFVEKMAAAVGVFAMTSEIQDRIDKVVEEKIEDLEIEVDNVSGFDDAVERIVEKQVENMTIHADNVEDLEDAIEQVISQGGGIDADDVKHLDDFVDARIDEKLGDQEIEADVIKGLDSFVDNAVTSAMDDVLEDKVVELLGESDKVKKNVCAVVENGMDATMVLCAK